MPPAKQSDTPQAEAHVIRTTRLFEAAGRHFNRGQRAFFFALGYLGWFVSPWVLFATTAAVVIVTCAGNSPRTPGVRWRASVLIQPEPIALQPLNPISARNRNR
jgi:uncharacterized membrane protein